MTKLNFWLAVFTGGLVLVGLIQCFISCLQWYNLKETNRITREKERAYLYFGNPEVIPYPSKNPVTAGVNITLVNGGGVNANLISVKGGWVSLKKNNDEQEFKFPLDKLSKIDCAKVLGAHQGAKFQSPSIPITVYLDAQKGNVNVSVLMEVKYRDRLSDDIRITRTSRNLRFDGHGSSSFGFEYNCVDEDCSRNKS